MPQELSSLKIGYVPMNDGAYHPFDLRNFIYYARQNNLDVEIAIPGNYYDLIVLSPKADISVWSKFPIGKTKIIFFLVDSYFAVKKWDIKNILRGFGKYFSGEHKILRINYSRALIEMCKRADGVICTTNEQKQKIQNYCENVHIILESHFKIIRHQKTDYSLGSQIKLVWEGRPENILALEQIRAPLIKLAKTHRISLHVITDLEYKKYTNKFVNASVIGKMKEIFGEKFSLNTVDGNHSLIYFYQWNTEMASKIVSECDLAVIPLDMNDPMMYGKPENKLLLFWRMGMPTLVPAIPAYVSVMDKCGLDMYCKSESDWVEKLKKYIADSEARKNGGVVGRAFAENQYSEKEYLKKWDNVLESIGLIS